MASIDSNVGDIQSVLDLSAAAGRVRRDRHQSGQETGEALGPVLDKLVDSRLNSLDLLSPVHAQHRVPVITRTPLRPSYTSTPSISPSHLSSSSVIQSLAPEVPSSPGSNISSIDGDAFEPVAGSLLSLSTRAPGSTIPSIVISAAMDDAKKQVVSKERALKHKLKNLDLDRVTEDLVVTRTVWHKNLSAYGET